MRTVIVVNNDIAGERFAIPFDTKEDALNWLGRWYLDFSIKFNEESETGKRLALMSQRDESYLIEDEDGGTVWARVFLQEEGNDGICLAFDSGDRDNYTLPLNPNDDEYEQHEDGGYGDADSYFFFTVKNESGKRRDVDVVK